MSNSDIAEKVNISLSTVYHYLSNNSNPYKELSYKKINKTNEDNIIDLYFNKNLTAKEIGSKYNISDATVMSFINNYKYTNTEITL